MSAKDLLDKIQISSPCEADWNSMIGNDRVRSCEHCNLTVHDLTQLTRKRVLRLIAKSNGQLCIRYRRRPDGSIVTRAAPQQLLRIGRRASRIAAGAFSATLSLSSALANTSTERPDPNSIDVAASTQDPVRQIYLGGTIVGTITDANGAVIVGATVSVWNDQRQLSLVTSSNAQGEYRFEDLEPGLYSLRSEASGFAPGDLGSVYLGPNKLQRVDKRLEVASIEAQVDVPSQESVVMGGAMITIVEPSEPLVKAAQDDELQDVVAALTRDNVNVRDKATGTSALEHAVRNANREMMQVLISAGADVNSRNGSKETVLMMLGEEATSEMVWDLIHAGAKVDLKDDEGNTALIEAAMIKNLNVLNALLHAGAKVDARNDEGQTALMLAAGENLTRNVKALITAGADMNARDREGKTTLNYAKENDHEKLVKLLLSYGAIEGDVRVKN
ncbi:MAG: ankyrin repeat domain-containing protein [Pyrinomonadaceae bacterium]